MYSLNDRDFKTETVDIVKQIFLNCNPLYPCFTEKIKNRCILFPCHEELNQDSHTKNDKHLLSAIVEAANSIGDTSCYISYLYWDGHDGNTNAFIPISDLTSAFGSEANERMCVKLDMGMGWEYMIFSSESNWGVVVSQYIHYALIGGCDDFMNYFYQLFPEAKNQVYLFLKFIESSQKCKYDRLKIDWLSPLLIHIYGYKKAKELLIETKVMRFPEVSIAFKK
jgi:hypothetical protein